MAWQMRSLRIKIAAVNIMSDVVNKYVKLVKGAGETVGKAVADTVTESFASPEKKSKKEDDATESDGYQSGYVIGISLYFIWLVIFAAGAATQSYRYNLNVGTGMPLTILYLVLAFIFPYFYYPFYTFFLCNSKGGQSGGRR
jgi:hypothetical protein